MSSTRRDPFLRAAQFVGDFASPFYAEERQRDVWNEASAFGLQLLVWAALLAGTVSIWVVGGPALPYVCAALALVGVVCWLTVAYAQRLGVVLTGRDRMLRWRMLPYLLLVVALLAGLARASTQPLTPSFLSGVATGAAVAVLMVVRGVRRAG